AASLRVAEQYVQAFGNIAKESTTMLLPSSAGNPANMMAQALTMYKSLIGNVSSVGSHDTSSTKLAAGVKGDASGETGNESPTTAKTTDTVNQIVLQMRILLAEHISMSNGQLGCLFLDTGKT
ncbi:hypothetical protein CMV_027845, partial [Castanea mollissima]